MQGLYGCIYLQSILLHPLLVLKKIQDFLFVLCFFSTSVFINLRFSTFLLLFSDKFFDRGISSCSESNISSFRLTNIFVFILCFSVFCFFFCFFVDELNVLFIFLFNCSDSVLNLF
jgi:hypothetical protein